MTLTTSSRTTTGQRRNVAAALFLLVGGAAFFAGGGLHPRGSDSGDKTEQLHSMLVDDLWYPAHAVLLLGMACFAAGFLAIRQRGGLGDRMGRLVSVVAWIAVAATLGAVVHLFAATQAEDIEDGGTTFLVQVFTGVETLLNPVWGLAIAALALAGGITRTVGNRIVLALGLVGGVAYAMATATIAFTDLFDPLFAVGALVGVWGVAVGVIGLVRGYDRPS
jgi:hypothetical protein